ncbi:pyridoxal-phosphate dependent enzyme [Parashewanella curva]|uniref:L-serine ammonia-lyase n=1 Tax=Parashewanella curva TaxID=2338552 RepID=A0A3L8PS30_9GAMM|nr:pyridoxal-phosphate dependent enzyme [Parashewanella curva]RLV58220.1 pyridoxal-phosphate dependent enzyme [Parashewanella curva]
MTKLLHINTPLIQSLSLGQKLNANVWLKMDAMQPSGSFKTRGIGFICQQYAKQGAKGFVSSSGGNAGLAVAYCGRQLNIPVTVYVPKTTKQRAIDLIQAEGATVIVKGCNWAEAHTSAIQTCSDHIRYIHPFDAPEIWQGHATIIDEVFDAGQVPDAVVLSVGGGGLLCGVVEGLKRNNAANTPILAVETNGADSLTQACQAGEQVDINNITSIATSLGATQVATQAFKYTQQYPITPHTVTDLEAIIGCKTLLDEHRILTEPACGASIAATLNCDNPFWQDKR